MPQKLRVGVIGLGGIAASHHVPNWALSPHCQLDAFCDINQPRLEKAAKMHDVRKQYTDWKDLLRDPEIDVVDVATPNVLHAPIAIAAMEAGKHVFCEKPMATNDADARRMLKTSQRFNRRLQINQHFRFHHTFRDLVPFATPDRLGTPYFAHARWHRRRRVPVAPTFLDRELSQGGPMLDLGVHIIDLAMLLMGSPEPVSVSASIGTYLGNRDDLGGDWGQWNPEKFQVEDFASMLFRFRGGATLFVETSWLGFHAQNEQRFVKVLGTKAGLHWPEGLIVSESQKIPTDLHLATPEEDTNEPYRRCIHGFVDAIVHDRPVPIPPEQNRIVVGMIDAAYESARAGREVPIALSAEGLGESPSLKRA